MITTGLGFDDFARDLCDILGLDPATVVAGTLEIGPDFGPDGPLPNVTCRLLFPDGKTMQATRTVTADEMARIRVVLDERTASTDRSQLLNYANDPEAVNAVARLVTENLGFVPFSKRHHFASDVVRWFAARTARQAWPTIVLGPGGKILNAEADGSAGVIRPLHPDQPITICGPAEIRVEVGPGMTGLTYDPELGADRSRDSEPLRGSSA